MVYKVSWPTQEGMTQDISLWQNSSTKIFGRPGYKLGLLVLSAVSTYSMCQQCMHVILITAPIECASLLGPHFLHVKIQAYGCIHT